MAKKQAKKVAKKVAKKQVKKIVKKVVKKSFDVLDGKEVVRTFKKKSVAEGWANERGLKIK